MVLIKRNFQVISCERMKGSLNARPLCRNSCLCRSTARPVSHIQVLNWRQVTQDKTSLISIEYLLEKVIHDEFIC